MRTCLHDWQLSSDTLYTIMRSEVHQLSFVVKPVVLGLAHNFSLVSMSSLLAQRSNSCGLVPWNEPSAS
jgi:hypothetical protein